MSRKTRKNFYKISNETSTLLGCCTTAAHKVYVTLNRIEPLYTNNGGWFYRTTEQLIDDATLSQKTVERAIRQLVSVGLIEKKRKHLKYANYTKNSEFTTNHYRIIH